MPRHEMQLADRKDLWRMLVMRLDNIGDIIMLGPALRSLREALPHTNITLMASPAGSQAAPLLPWVDEVITWRAVWQELSNSKQFEPQNELELVADLRNGKYDAAFIFTSFSQSPFPPAYACYLAGIPIRVGHSKEFGGQVLTHSSSPPPDFGHQVDRNLALLELNSFPVAGRHLELDIPSHAQLSTQTLLSKAGYAQDEPYILLAPGASCSSRRYDPARFAKVAQALPELSGMRLIIAGSKREASKIEPVINAAKFASPGSIISLVGQTSVLEFAELIRRSRLVIANNSASLHIADAFKRPMVILYSGTEYLTQWEPRSAPAQLLRVDTDCSPCFSFECPFSMECLDIQPEQVLKASLLLLEAEEQSASQPMGVALK
jgi:lipopolysaccharide heptosyltransferase II